MKRGEVTVPIMSKSLNTSIRCVSNEGLVQRISGKFEVMVRIYEFRTTWQTGVRYLNLTNNGLIVLNLYWLSL